MFLFAALLWPAVREAMQAYLEQDELPEQQALQAASQEVLQEQVQRVAIPKRISIPMREIWNLQLRLARRGGRRAGRLLGHPRFRAAYDFMLLRAEVGEVEQEVADWWTAFQAGSDEERRRMTEQTAPSRRRRRRRRRPPAASE